MNIALCLRCKDLRLEGQNIQSVKQLQFKFMMSFFQRYKNVSKHISKDPKEIFTTQPKTPDLLSIMNLISQNRS